MVCRIFATFSILLLLSGPTLNSASGQSFDWVSHVVELAPGTASNSTRVATPVLTEISVRPTQRVLAAAGDDHVVRLWQLESGNLIAELVGHEDWVRASAFSPAGSELATGGNDQTVIIWDLASNQEKHRIPLEFAVADLAFSPDGLYLAAVGYAGHMAIVGIDSDMSTVRLACPCPDMRAVCYSPDGSLLAAGGRDGTVQIWDAVTHEVVDSTETHRGRVRDLEFTPDGTRLVSCGDDRRICIRSKTSSGWEARSLPSRPTKFLTFTFAAGRILVGGTDNRIRVWDLSTFQEEGILSGHSGSVCTLEAVDGGFVSGSFDTTLRVWSQTSAVSTPR
jgi:WD40 repeat protein